MIDKIDKVIDNLDAAVQRRCEWEGREVAKIQCTQELFDELTTRHMGLFATGKQPKMDNPTFSGILIEVDDELKEPFRIID